MLASAEVNAQDKADQLRSIERARLRPLVDADIPTASRPEILCNDLTLHIFPVSIKRRRAHSNRFFTALSIPSTAIPLLVNSEWSS